MRGSKVVMTVSLALAVFVPMSAAFAGGGTVTGADVQVSGSASTGSPGPGQPFSYTFQVKNSGPDTATAVAFRDTLPAGTVYKYATVNGYSGPCSVSGNDGGGGNVSCNVGDITKGGQAVVLVSLDAPMTAGSFTDTGTASSSASDPQPSNNSVTVTAQVKVATCPLPAGMTTLNGYVEAGSPDSGGAMQSFLYVGNDGVTYTVLTNYYDGSQPLTTVINLNCQQTPVQFIQVGEFVNITGTVDAEVFPGSTTAVPVIHARVIQVPFYKDKI